MPVLKRFLYCICAFLPITIFAQSFLEGPWEGTEQRTHEWGTIVSYTKAAPLKIEINIDTPARSITVNRLFDIRWNGKKTTMIATMNGYFRGSYYAMQNERITSRDYVSRYPGLYSDMPHYLFDDGHLWYYIDGNEIVLQATMQLYERRYYDNSWTRPNADWHGAHFKEREDPAVDKGKYDDYYGGYTKPVIIPGGFFYKEPGEYNSKTFNRHMATYFWMLRKKLSPDQLKEASTLLVHNETKEVQSPKKDTASIINEVVLMNNKNITVAVFDNAIEDGDIITLMLNGERIATKMKVLKEKQMIKLNLKAGENLLTMLAENEGQIPPNTAAFTFDDNGVTKTIILNATKGKTQSVKIIAK